MLKKYIRFSNKAPVFRCQGKQKKEEEEKRNLQHGNHLLIQEIFEKNNASFRPYLDLFRDFFRRPNKNNNKSLHKTDRCDVLSDF